MIPSRINTRFVGTLLGLTLAVAICASASRNIFLGFATMAMVWFVVGYIIGAIESTQPLKAGTYPGIRIVCPANRYRGSDEEAVILGVRHTDAFMRQQLHEVYGSPKNWPDLEEQGFVDQHGNFYSREEAYEIAKAAGQIVRRCGGDEGRLYSENLY